MKMMNNKNKETKDIIIQELNNIFEIYKLYMINEYKKIDKLNYKIILINSVLNRSIAIIEAYKQIIRTNNIIVLSSLTRMQIDNCIFVYGIYILLENGYEVEELFKNILFDNKKLSDYKIEKQKLYDTYIISKINEEYNNKFEDMYNFYCRFIHYSDSALLSSILAKEDNVLELGLTKDYSRFEHHILENGKSFIELCKFLLVILKQKWKNMKINEELQ